MDGKAIDARSGVGAAARQEREQSALWGAHYLRRIAKVRDEILDAMPVALAILFVVWGWRPVALIIGRLMGWC